VYVCVAILLASNKTLLYVLEMTRLTRDDWIQFGLTILKTEGYSQLKAGSLAKRLKVSRGSFYWYFEDLDAYHSALLAKWRAASEDVASALVPTLGPQDKLLALMNATTEADFELELAFRAWGREHGDVGRQIDQLDDMRLGVVRSIVGQAVSDPAQAESCARFTYAAAIGLMALGKDKVGVSAADLARIVSALLGQDEVK